MPQFLALVLTVLAAGGAYLHFTASPAGNATFPPAGALRFPEVSGEALDRTTHRLPGTFGGEVNLVFIAFRQWHQELVNTWLPLAQELESEMPGLRYYELPTISERGPFQRSFIDNGMRAGIPDPGARAATITLYTDVERFVEALDLAGTDTIHALLVDREGNVSWRASGALDAEAERGLRAALAERGN